MAVAAPGRLLDLLVRLRIRRVSVLRLRLGGRCGTVRAPSGRAAGWARRLGRPAALAAGGAAPRPAAYPPGNGRRPGPEPSSTITSSTVCRRKAVRGHHEGCPATGRGSPRGCAEGVEVEVVGGARRGAGRWACSSGGPRAGGSRRSPPEQLDQGPLGVGVEPEPLHQAHVAPVGLHADAAHHLVDPQGRIEVPTGLVVVGEPDRRADRTSPAGSARRRSGRAACSCRPVGADDPVARASSRSTPASSGGLG